MSQPVVLIAEELSPATIDALGPDFDVRNVDGTDRPALLTAIADADAILIRSATKMPWAKDRWASCSPGTMSPTA